MSDAAETFEPHRRYLTGIAYRMLGSVAEAEDVVQDAFLRWDGSDRSAVAAPRAFLARVVSRLCLDRMKSARAQREEYVGTWLPEPLVGAAPRDPAALAEDLSIALLMTLERLSPLERAAFLLHDVFDMDYAQIADVLERSEAAVRQLATRGREHVRDERPRFHPTDDASARLASAFQAAMLQGDVPGIARLLAEDAILYSDGGGKRVAALNPIRGKDRIVRFMVGLASKRRLPVPDEVIATTINGLPGFVVRIADGTEAGAEAGIETIALEISDGAIAAIYTVRNPDKLRHLAQ
jgi:RNA polymerase sigma-70 factor (ECF subfamily)